MSNKKATKRALLTSILAICLCLVMLIGSTFAWFTDTASTGVNTIQSGTLKVDIVDTTDAQNSLKGETLKFVQMTENNGLTTPESGVFWEPGATFRTEEFRIKNAGSLALKWKMDISGGITTKGDVASDFNLLNVITFYIVKKTDTGTEKVDLAAFEGQLTKQTLSDVYYLEGTMDTTAGNDYQGLSLDGVAITVYATQAPVEYDSNNNTYDKDAAWDGTYPTERPDTFVVDEENHIIYLNSTAAFFYLNTFYSGSEKASEFADSAYWGYDIVLNTDINMMNIPFQPILLGHTWMCYNFYESCREDARYETWGDRQRGEEGITAYGEFSKFDGNGHTISNINLVSDDAKVGLFAEVNNVCNLKLENVSIKATNKNAMVGALAASHANDIIDRNVAEACIENVHVKNVTILGDGKYVGGLIGYSGNNIINCSVETGSVTGSNSVGALIGFVDSFTAKIEDCTVSGIKLTNNAAEETVRTRIGYIAGRTNLTGGNTLTVIRFTETNIAVGDEPVTEPFGKNEVGVPSKN